MEYRIDFFVGFFTFLVTQATGIAFIYLIFRQIPHLAGWSFEEIMFIYGFAQIPKGIDHLFTDNLWALSGRIIVRGEFDRYLLRPINPLFHLIAEVFQPDAFGELAVGIILVIIAVIRLGITFTILDIFLFGVAIIFATLIYTSVKLIFASLAFWIKFSQAFLYMTYSLSDFAKYPITIYSKWIRKVLTFIVPFAFTAYFPASYFVDKVDGLVAIGGTILVGVVFSVISYSVWLRGISVYESAGS